MTDEEKKNCLYRDKNAHYYDEHYDGCCTCAECYIDKCPVAVERMTESEKRFYGVYKNNNSK